MRSLVEKYIRKVSSLELTYERSAIEFLSTDHRLLGLGGARGTGKTTLLLQFAGKQADWRTKTLYASLDDFWFSSHRLSELADDFTKRGGRLLLLDEVHKYPEWSRELKSIYDDYPELNVVFTGSSLMEILNARADLSRRAVVSQLQGLSFREYLGIETGAELPKLELTDILTNHVESAAEITKEMRPLEHFDHYLHRGYYPLFYESKSLYFDKLEAVVRMIMEIELPLLRGVDPTYVPKLKQLMVILAESAPFIPNITKLSERIGISRRTLLGYVDNLQEAGLLKKLFREARGISRLQKPDKLYPENSNLAYLLSPNADRGTVRETFFANQLGHSHRLTYPAQGDFKVDGQYGFEVGGKNKDTSRFDRSENDFYALDGLEIGHGQVIPLWLFGFLY